MGVVVREMTMETRMAVERVMANSRKRRPTIPPMRSKGMKTAISEMLMVKTVKPISFAPLRVAAEGSMPASRGGGVVSMTTMGAAATKAVGVGGGISGGLSRLEAKRDMNGKVRLRGAGTA